MGNILCSSPNSSKKNSPINLSPTQYTNSHTNSLITTRSESISISSAAPISSPDAMESAITKIEQIEQIEQLKLDDNLQPHTTCPICMDELTDPINLCTDKSHQSICKTCIVAYIESVINSAYNGSCPAINCPFIHSDKRQRLLIYDEWIKIVSNDVIKKYNVLAKSLLLFLCGGCHKQSSLDVGFSSRETRLLAGLIDVELIPQYVNDRTAFCNGALTLDNFYSLITKKYIKKITSVENSTAWKMFSNILMGIDNPMRRANLHLRYLRDRPKIETLCCKRVHCFECKTKDFHENTTCLEIKNRNKQTDEILICSNCGVTLVRGDGCDAITCVCGRQFSWVGELKNYKAFVLFSTKFNGNTNKSCADILCSTLHPDMEPAKLWYARNTAGVNKYLKEKIMATYGPNRLCVSQKCTTLDITKLTLGIQHGINAWKNEHEKEIEHLKKQGLIALESLFLTMHMPGDRALAAQELTNMKITKNTSHEMIMLSKSANMWISKNKDEFNRKTQMHKIRVIEQFLMLYGNKKITANMTIGFNESHRYMHATTNTHISELQRNCKQSFYQKKYNNENSKKWLELCNGDISMAKAVYVIFNDAFNQTFPRVSQITQQSNKTNKKSNHMDEFNQKVQRLIESLKIDAVVSDSTLDQPDMIDTDSVYEKLNNVPFKFTYNTFLCAVSWYNEHNKKFVEEQLRRDADTFHAIHQESAPFCAAMYAHNINTSNNKEEKSLALAYMKCYRPQMHNWYDENCASKDPIITRIPIHCRCLPRHTGTCNIKPKLIKKPSK